MFEMKAYGLVFTYFTMVCGSHNLTSSDFFLHVKNQVLKSAVKKNIITVTLLEIQEWRLPLQAIAFFLYS